jgi:hypothetical protein
MGRFFLPGVQPLHHKGKIAEAGPAGTPIRSPMPQRPWICGPRRDWFKNYATN